MRLNGRSVIGFGEDVTTPYDSFGTFVNGLLIGWATGAIAGGTAGYAAVRKHRGVGAIVGGIVGGIGGGFAGIAIAKSKTPAAAPSSSLEVTGVNPNYIIKYNAQALQLASLPSPQGPVMLCSYIPFAQLESTDPASGYSDFQKLRAKYETAPEDFYGKKGRTHIARLVKRYFDPKTFKELPSDILYESDQKFPIPISPDPGIPCG